MTLRLSNYLLKSFSRPIKPIYKPRLNQDGKLQNAWGREEGMIWSPEYVPTYISPTLHRNKKAEKMQLISCLKKRKTFNIPEFYAGSIIRVTYADRHVGKLRFAGRCLFRDGYGNDARFVLRNILDNEGVEIEFLLYSPLIHQIEVLRLERWLDDDLRYLRDAPREYCRVHLDMIAEPAPPRTEKLEPFTGKIRMLNPAFWSTPWQRMWPEPQNIYFEEWQLAEDKAEDDAAKDRVNASAVDIVYHYDWRDEKERIMKDMMDNFDEINEYDLISKKFENRKK